MTNYQIEAAASLCLPIKFLTLFRSYLFFIFNLSPYYACKYKANWKLLLYQFYDVSGVRIFFEDEKDVPNFRASFAFEELLPLVLNISKAFVSALSQINKIIAQLQIAERLQPELFISKLDWQTLVKISPELVSIYLNLNSRFALGREIYGFASPSLQTKYSQTNIKTYSAKLNFDFLIDILLDVWINVFEYVDAYLSAPWIIILP